LILIVGAQSATALVLAAILAMNAVLLVLAYRLPQMLKPLPLVLALAVAVVAMLVLPDYLLGLVGKDPTLTGRLPLWRTVFLSIQERPLLGYGYGAFWRGWAGPSARVWTLHLWEPPHAHNGYLDLWLDLGLVGLALGLGLLAITLARGLLTSLARTQKESHRFAYLFAVFFFAFNVVQSAYLASGMLDALYWILFTYAYLVSGRSSTFAIDSGGGTISQ
jgi:O-antigen ligase